ncbi:MAG: hypothetical protein ABQ298_10340 [Puniceicoccaceae bacterium]
MKPSDLLNRFHDQALSEEEIMRLEAMIDQDSELAEALASLQFHTELHRESMPDPKDADFIQAEWNAIQSQLPSRRIEENTASAQKDRTSDAGRSLIPFLSIPWLSGTLAAAAALAVAVTGIWMWSNSSADSLAPSQGQIDFVQTDIDGASSMIFMDEQSGWTFVWIDEPLNASEAAG